MINSITKCYPNKNIYHKVYHHFIRPKLIIYHKRDAVNVKPKLCYLAFIYWVTCMEITEDYPCSLAEFIIHSYGCATIHRYKIPTGTHVDLSNCKYITYLQ